MTRLSGERWHRRGHVFTVCSSGRTEFRKRLDDGVCRTAFPDFVTHLTLVLQRVTLWVDEQGCVISEWKRSWGTVLSSRARASPVVHEACTCTAGRKNGPSSDARSSLLGETMGEGRRTNATRRAAGTNPSSRLSKNLTRSRGKERGNGERTQGRVRAVRRTLVTT